MSYLSRQGMGCSEFNECNPKQAPQCWLSEVSVQRWLDVHESDHGDTERFPRSQASSLARYVASTRPWATRVIYPAVNCRLTTSGRLYSPFRSMSPPAASFASGGPWKHPPRPGREPSSRWASVRHPHTHSPRHSQQGGVCCCCPRDRRATNVVSNSEALGSTF